MALPTLAKTWDFSQINQIIGATGNAQTTRRNLMLAIHNSLKAAGMVVDHSCSSTAAGAPGDGVDRWVAASDIVWATGAGVRSWMVYSNPAFGANYRLLLHCFKTTGGTLEIVIDASFSTHASGYSGGTTTAGPTATNSVSLRNGVQGTTGAWDQAAGADFSSVLHVMFSTDGECIRLFICQANFVTAFWLFDLAIPCHSGWTPPIVNMIVGAGSAAHISTYATLNAVTPMTSTTPPAASRGVSSMQLAFTGEAHGGAVEGSKIQVPNDLTSPPEYHLGAIGLASDTAANRGRHGNLVDIWWANSGAAADAGAPASGVLRQFMSWRDIITPWDADVPGGVDGSICLRA